MLQVQVGTRFGQSLACSGNIGPLLHCRRGGDLRDRPLLLQCIGKPGSLCGNRGSAARQLDRRRLGIARSLGG